jgi:peptide/nickel transport system substrate-binding protein
LRSGQLDIIERMAGSDVPSLKTDSRFKVARITEVGYQGITINVGKKRSRAKNPLGGCAVRETFELTLDRDGIDGRDGWRSGRGTAVGRSRQCVLLQERSYP